jgi:ATP-dependent RNA helicase DDX27
MAPDDFIMTLDSEEEPEPSSGAIRPSKHPSAKKADEALLDPAFTFDMSGDPYTDLIQGEADFADLVKSGSRPVRLFGASSCSLNIVWLGSNIRR